MKQQTVVLQHSRLTNSYIVAKLVNRLTPKVGTALKETEVQDLILERDTKVEITEKK
jgi:hypothetical protein